MPQTSSQQPVQHDKLGKQGTRAEGDYEIRSSEMLHPREQAQG